MMSKLLLATLPLASLATASSSGIMLARIDRDGRSADPCPLKQTHVSGRIDGPVARVTVTQEFVNPTDSTIEAVYVFPLPENAAVDDFSMRIGDRSIRGVIKRREEAQALYDAARRKGQAAALLAQERPNIFRQHVANILRGATVRIEIRYVVLLQWRLGGYEFVFPTVVGPRYKAAESIDPPIAAQGARAGHDVHIDLEIDGGDAIRNIAVDSYEAVIARPSPTRANVKLKDGAVLPNKDFILRYSTAAERIEDSLIAHRDERGGFFTLTLTPPAVPARESEIMPKEIVFVLDTSGSMMGFPIEKAKEAMRLALDGLHKQDTFNLITFSGDTHVLFPKPVPATAENLKSAQEFLASRRGSGGTEMLKAIRTALAPSGSDAVRVVCFMTDGYVGNDREILAEIQKHSGARVFSFGIGQSVNRFLLDKMAEFGRGEVEYVTLESDGSAAAKRFHERVRNPLLTDIAIHWNGLPVSDVHPSRVPDLFDAKPIVLTGRYDAAAKGTVRLTGKLGGKPFSRDIAVDFSAVEAKRDAIPTLWARRKVASLAGDALLDHGGSHADEITKLGLDFRIMTQYTSFVAVEDKVINEGGQVRRIEVPIEMPEGVSHEGIFGGAPLAMRTAAFAGVGGAVGGYMPKAELSAQGPPLPVPAPSVAPKQQHVMIVLKQASAENIAKLVTLGFQRSDEGVKRLLFGYLPAEKIEQVRKLPEVFSVLVLP